MIISRVKAGVFMIGGSIFLFLVAALLTDESQAATNVADLTPWQNFLVVDSIVLLITGIYFVISSKRCPACGEKVRRTDTECRYCAWIFKMPHPQ